MIRNIFLTITAYFFLVLLGVLFFTPFMIARLLPAKKRATSRWVYWCSDWFYRMVLWAARVPITFKGKENLPDDPAIFALNHQSALDIPIAGALARAHPHLWLARSELLGSPILRILLGFSAEVVNVNSPIKAMRSLLRIIAHVRETKQHIIIFPEGQRYTDGDVHEFFAGFVILAKKTGRPVIPVRIFGVNKVYPPTGYMMHWQPVTVVIGKPFHYDESEDEGVFCARVYQWFTSVTEEGNS